MRLFFGLSLSSQARAYTAACAELAASCVPGRYAPADNHHLTLAFLGGVEEARLPDAQRVLAQCIAAFPAPRITLGELDCFGPLRSAILILRAESRPALEPLHEALCAALLADGLPCSPGPFCPHVTLARRAVLSEAQLAALNAARHGEGASFIARRAHVFLSARDEHQMLRYTPLLSADFAPSSSE